MVWATRSLQAPFYVSLCEQRVAEKSCTGKLFPGLLSQAACCTSNLFKREKNLSRAVRRLRGGKVLKYITGRNKERRSEECGTAVPIAALTSWANPFLSLSSSMKCGIGAWRTQHWGSSWDYSSVLVFMLSPCCTLGLIPRAGSCGTPPTDKLR